MRTDRGPMISLRGGLAKRHFALLLAAATPACGRDSATGPASSDSALQLEAVSATALETTVGEPVNPVPTVIVRSETGQPVPGIKVTFLPLYPSDSAYGDFVTKHIVITNSQGLASPDHWTLGTMSGLHGLEAGILGAHLSDADGGTRHAVAFHAEAKAAAPAALSMSFTGDTVGLPGDELYAPIVRVTDRYGNGASGVTITFSIISGGGSLEKDHDEARWGSASPGTWKLGPKPGLNSFVASAPGLNSVTFKARALNAGAVTWYDLKPQSVRLIVTGSIALCEDGTFELVTVETSDALPGEWLVRQLGTYTLTGTSISLTYSIGVTEQGTLVGDSLSLVHKKLNWVGDPPREWTFARRP